MHRAEAKIPQVGQRAPAFSLANEQGREIALADLKHQPVVLYFYPRDDTPGCTIEAKGFRDNLQQFEQRGALVLGVSPDSVDSHCKFADKYGLNFHLLSDPSHAVAEKYGVWVEKNRYGKTYTGIQRATFLISPDGKIAKVWPNVTPDGHAKEVLDAIKGLAA